MKEKARLNAEDAQVLEKCILALELVGRFRQAGLSFIFKGGTSLLLHQPEPKRLSIDVDILSLEPLDRLRDALENECNEYPFTGWRHQEERDRDEPPTKHFEIHFDSVINPAIPGAILLDVIHADNPYAKTVEKPLDSSFVRLEAEVTIEVPSVSSLLGDKLAAFAPSTIGFPYQPLNRKGEPYAPRPVQVVKHLFDIGQLAILADAPQELLESYHSIHLEQCNWRGQYSRQACLEDTQKAAMKVCQVETMKEEAKDSKLEFFRKGILSVASHLFREKFGRSEARIAAGRAAFVAELVKRESMDFELMASLNEELDLKTLKNAQLKEPWDSLESLKKTDVAAYALWEKAQRFGQSNS